jgi:hypothetical protein
MDTLWLATVLLAMCSILGFLAIARMRAHAKRINDYFLNAVIVWLWLEHVAAKLAALAAAKVAARRQRGSMQRCLLTMIHDFEEVSSTIPELRASVVRIRDLHAEIAVKHWTVRDATEAKRLLANYDSEYLLALDRADDKVFVRRFPNLFSAESLLDVVQAAAAYKRAELGNLEVIAAAFDRAHESSSAGQFQCDG